MYKKFIFLFLGIAVLGVNLELIYFYLNPEINRQGLDIQACFASSQNIDHYSFKAWNESGSLVAHFLPVAPSNCLSPKFPLIHVSYTGAVDGWLHVVHTSQRNSKKQDAFIDHGNPAIPFYTQDSVFEDMPFWNSSFFLKPLHQWIGHIYAVKIQGKTIKAVAGIAWGFSFPLFGLGPKPIQPTRLTQSTWLDGDKDTLQSKFPQYHFE